MMERRQDASAAAGRRPALLMQLKFRWLTKSLFAIVRFAANSPVPEWATYGEFTSVSRTPDELSIVCPIENLPADVSSPHRWICLKLEGPFPFSQTGVLLSFIEPLSSKGIPIFAMSTYDTDYVLIQQEWAGAALMELRTAGHQLWDPDPDQSRRQFLK